MLELLTSKVIFIYSCLLLADVKNIKKEKLLILDLRSKFNFVCIINIADKL